MPISFVLTTAIFLAAAGGDQGPRQLSEGAREVEYDESAFRSGPQYPEPTFDPDQQQAIYGDKFPIDTQRPLIEWGRDLYTEGPFTPSYTFLGKKNPVKPSFFVYGDVRAAAGLVDTGGGAGSDEVGRFAIDANLELDLRITSTERVHAFVSPFDKNGNFTGFDFAGDQEGREEIQLDANFDALFFEGDMGAIYSGASGKTNKFDLPFAFGLMPLLFQNGVWVEDAFQGLAVTIPARNSATLGISNFDTTFFAGFDDVTTGAALLGGGDDNDAHIFGVTTFIEANEGYWEAGYAYVDMGGNVSDLDYHNLTAAFTRRYGGWLSNSVRMIANFGQDPGRGQRTTADGLLVLVENSLVTSKPYTFVPYANFFLGINRPQSLARAAAAGGVLKNTGINFEGDALTLFPSLDATGHDAVGAAVGVNYLFNLDKQLVFEIAGQKDHGDKALAPGAQFGAGVRVQYPFYNRFIVRADAMVGVLENTDNIAGVRFEFRWKF
ncbi:MAG: hypothetical protein AAF488_11285 [Planctomycetota bacterium]